MNIPDKILLCATLAVHATAFAASPDVNVRVRTGDVTAFAAGENASAQVSLGGLPASGRKGCARFDVKAGDIQKIAVGPNARAAIELPAHSIQCGEKQP